VLCQIRRIPSHFNKPRVFSRCSGKLAFVFRKLKKSEYNERKQQKIEHAWSSSRSGSTEGAEGTLAATNGADNTVETGIVKLLLQVPSLESTSEPRFPSGDCNVDNCIGLSKAVAEINEFGLVRFPDFEVTALCIGSNKGD
jgi:hypothetical protein